MTLANLAYFLVAPTLCTRPATRCCPAAAAGASSGAPQSGQARPIGLGLGAGPWPCQLLCCVQAAVPAAWCCSWWRPCWRAGPATRRTRRSSSGAPQWGQPPLVVWGARLGTGLRTGAACLQGPGRRRALHKTLTQQRADALSQTHNAGSALPTRPRHHIFQTI